MARSYSLISSGMSLSLLPYRLHQPVVLIARPGLDLASELPILSRPVGPDLEALPEAPEDVPQELERDLQTLRRKKRP